MEFRRRNFLVYGVLLAVWALILGWQAADHVRVRHLARAELIHRAQDVSTTVGTTIRLLRRFGGVVSKERLESALTELLRPGEWDGIALLNEGGDVVASAGAPVNLGPKGAVHPAEVWTEKSVILINPVALGTNVTRDLEGTNPPVIVDFHRGSDTNGPPVFRRGEAMESTNRPAPDPDRFRRGGVGSTNEMAERPDFSTNAFRMRGRWPRFTRPPWWSEDEWKAMLERQGVHSFAIMMSTRNYREACSRDRWLRAIIGLLATVSVVGFGLAWGNQAKTSELQIRLVRTSEMNIHLKEMNLAAAGLAHETRNPLNIVRGLAQMISKRPDAPHEIRSKSREIIDETDKVTVQLNEFINYSRPRELRRAALSLNGVAGEVVRALDYDIEERRIQIETKGDPIWIEADEQMLRQVLFNLVLNAIQAVPEGGVIRIVTQRRDATEGLIEIQDNGPGVPPERRAEIFKPYFTTQQKGTGLGLAIVRQIVLAHGWEIECLSNQPQGAIFRITHLKLAAKPH